MKHVIASCVSKCFLKRKPHPRCQFPWWRLLFQMQNSKGGLPNLARHGPGRGSAGQMDFLQISTVLAVSLSWHGKNAIAQHLIWARVSLCIQFHVANCLCFPVVCPDVHPWCDGIHFFSLLSSVQVNAAESLGCLSATWSSMIHL